MIKAKCAPSVSGVEESPWGLEQGVGHGEFMEIFEALPEIGEILQKSESLEEAREKLLKFAGSLRWKFKGGEIEADPIDRWLAIYACDIFENILSPYNEKTAGFSTLEYLWKASKGDEKILSILTRGFLEEFRHLFLAMSGKANYSKGWLGPKLEEAGIISPDFSKVRGREAGRMRSDYLDKVYEYIKAWLDRYPTGLDERIIKKREEQRKALEDYWGISDDEWFDYKWQFSHVLKGKKGYETLKELNELGIVKVPEEDLEEAKRTALYEIP